MSATSRMVYFIDSEDQLLIKRGCRVCGVTQTEIHSHQIIVSPLGVAHHGDEYGKTVCGKDATRDGWWWPL